MIRQLSLFDAPARPIPASDPNVPPEAKARLSKQCRSILERLRVGPATNAELSAIGLKYCNRIQEIREAGHVVTCLRNENRTGLTRYRLDHDAGDKP